MYKLHIESVRDVMTLVPPPRTRPGAEGVSGRVGPRCLHPLLDRSPGDEGAGAEPGQENCTDGIWGQAGESKWMGGILIGY